MTFSCGGLDAFFQSSKKIKDKQLLYFACPGPMLVCLSDLFTRLLAWTLLQVSLQSYLQSKKIYLSWMTGQDLFLGPMFLYTGEQQKRKPHNFFCLKRATKSLIPGFLRKAKIRRLDPCHSCEGGSWRDVPMPSLLCTSPARNKIFWPVGLVLYLKGLLITFSLTCHATM